MIPCFGLLAFTDSDDTGATNLAEYLATEVVKGRGLSAPLMRIWGVSITRNTRGRLGSTYY